MTQEVLDFSSGRLPTTSDAWAYFLSVHDRGILDDLKKRLEISQ